MASETNFGNIYARLNRTCWLIQNSAYNIHKGFS